MQKRRAPSHQSRYAGTTRSRTTRRKQTGVRIQVCSHLVFPGSSPSRAVDSQTWLQRSSRRVVLPTLPLPTGTLLPTTALPSAGSANSSSSSPQRRAPSQRPLGRRPSSHPQEPPLPVGVLPVPSVGAIPRLQTRRHAEAGRLRAATRVAAHGRAFKRRAVVARRQPPRCFRSWTARKHRGARETRRCRPSARPQPPLALLCARLLHWDRR